MAQARSLIGPVPRSPGDRRLLAVDATSVVRPGPSGRYFRVHYAISLPEFRCEFIEVTDSTEVERFERFPVAPRDLFLADRGYCTREGVAHILESGGDVLMRLHSTALPLLHRDSEQRLDLRKRLQSSQQRGPRAWEARLEFAGRRWPVRVCSIRKSQEAAELAKRRILRRASKSQRAVRQATLDFAEHVMVLTTLPETEIDAAGALELYRARWQIELTFKRLKSLLDLDDLPKTTDASAVAWIQGKLLTALLIEALARESRLFSPWGFDLAAAQRMA
jgi:hypothetical protein